MDRPVTVACVQAEPVVLDRGRTLDRLEERAAEAARNGAELVVFPETFVPVYPSSRWAKAFAGWQNEGAKETFARIAQNAVAVDSPAEHRLGAVAKELGVWLVTGVNEIEAERPGTIYNSLLYHAPDGSLALHHRKLVPTNHERLIRGQGDGRGLHAVQTGFGRIGGLICWQNYMPLARLVRRRVHVVRRNQTISAREDVDAVPLEAPAVLRHAQRPLADREVLTRLEAARREAHVRVVLEDPADVRAHGIGPFGAL